MKKHWLKELTVGETITEYYALRKAEVRTKNDGANFLRLEVGDKSGRVGGVLWDDADAAYQNITVGGVVKIMAKVDAFQGRTQLKVEKIRAAHKGEYDPADLLPTSTQDRDAQLERLKKIMDRVENPFLKKLLDAFFDDSQFKVNYVHAVGGKLWHHAYVGGLLEHSLCVTEIALKAADNYPLVDRDLLITGAILHDIGKIEEYEVTTFVDFSDEGRLRGHIVMGDEMVRTKIKGLMNFPDHLARKVSHMILAHQGKLEFGSPVVPQTIEALILFYADEMDSKANAFGRIITETREKDAEKSWSEWVHLMGQYVYTGE